MRRRIAIIPARGGSKRIPRKNILNFCGKPMIAYILQAAKEANLFDVIHVSTESLAIKEVVEDLGFRVDFLRPEFLADDYTPIMPVLKYVVEVYKNQGEIFDEVWLLMACAPLIDASDLKGASNLFKIGGNAKPVISVSEYPTPIEWAFSRSDGGDLTPLEPGKFAIRSQDIKKKYFDAGLFCIFPMDRVIESDLTGSDQGLIGYIIPKTKAVDIDDECDWKIAEALFIQNSKKLRRF